MSESPETVTTIVPVQRDPNLRRIKIGRTTAATLRASDIESLRIVVGTRWTARLAADVAQAVKINTVRKAALNLLGRRAFSRLELIDRLERKQHDSAIANQVVDELAVDGWIDDVAYGKSVAMEVLRQ